MSSGMQDNRGAAGGPNSGLWRWLVLGYASSSTDCLARLFCRITLCIAGITTASVLSFISLGVWLTFTIGRINIGRVHSLLSVDTRRKFSVQAWTLVLALPAIVRSYSRAYRIIFGLGILRLKGVYFAMITLSLTEAVRLGFLSGGDFTGGAPGIPKFHYRTNLSFSEISLGFPILGKSTRILRFIPGCCLAYTWPCRYLENFLQPPWLDI
ncbi:MAG: hypothetical protein Ct9H300mP16_09330 [Pseudomonadota bacterium]|nr:MAG: hypothetical protein Ct9H300mP16_09330 [Pseudomonadota bacterium]